MAKKKAFGIPKQLSEGIGETISMANNNIGQLRYEIVPLNRIELDKNNPRDLLIDKQDVMNGLSVHDPQYERKKNELETLHTLSFSIKKVGIRSPIEVYKENEKYILISGERRVLASLLSGKTDIPAKILNSKPDELQLRFLQWIENIERQDLSIWEKLGNIEQLIQAYQSSVDGRIDEYTLSEIIGCSVKQSKRYLDVLQASPELKKLLQNAGISDLIKCALIANTKNVELRSKLISEASRGATREDISKLLRTTRTNLQKFQQETNMRGRPKKSISLAIPIQKLTHLKYIVERVLDLPEHRANKTKFQFIDWFNAMQAKKAFESFVDVINP